MKHVLSILAIFSAVAVVSFSVLPALSPDFFDQSKYSIAIVSFDWVIIFSLIYALNVIRKRLQDSDLSSPIILAVIDDEHLLTAPCAWLTYFTAVVIFKVRDEIEIPIATGEVIHIQNNLTVQIRYYALPNSEIDELRNLQDVKENLLIKPGTMRAWQ